MHIFHIHPHDPSTFPASERKQQNHCSSKDTPMIALIHNISDLGGILSAIDVNRPAIDGIIMDFSIDTEEVDHIQAILEMMQSQ